MPLVRGQAGLLDLSLLWVILLMVLSSFFTVYLHVHQHPTFLLHGSPWTRLPVKRGHFCCCYLSLIEGLRICLPCDYGDSETCNHSSLPNQIQWKECAIMYTQITADNTLLSVVCVTALSQPPNPRRSAPHFWVVSDMLLFPFISLKRKCLFHFSPAQ